MRNIFDSSISTKNDLRTLDSHETLSKALGKGRRAVSTLRPGAIGKFQSKDMEDQTRIFEASVNASAVRAARLGGDSEVLASMTNDFEMKPSASPMFAR